jgi:hypothetical protein
MSRLIRTSITSLFIVQVAASHGWIEAGSDNADKTGGIQSTEQPAAFTPGLQFSNHTISGQPVSSHPRFELSPCSYINQTMLCEVCHLLASGEVAADIASDVGFYDQSQMIRYSSVLLG